MIRKGITLIILIIIVLFGCEETENPNKIPDDAPRLDEINANYMTILSSSEYGWKARYQPSGSYGVYNMLMKFTEEGTVELKSDLNGYQNSSEKVLYAVKGATFPELIFETFCVWHQIYEVAEGVFQFRIQEINENTVTLSKVNMGSTGTEVTLTTATPEDYEAIEKKQDIDSILYNYYNNFEEDFKVVDFSQQNIKGLVDFDFDTHQFYISYTDNNGNAQNSIANYSYDENGLEFVSELTINGIEIDRFDVVPNSDTSIILVNDQVNQGILTSTDFPDFEFKGAIDLFSQNTIYELTGISDALDTIYNKTQVKEGAIIALYQNYIIPPTTSFSALSFIIFESNEDYDWYSFFIDNFQKLGEDRVRFQWSGERSSNIDNELFLDLRDFILFFFDKNGFKVVPNRGVFTLISYADHKKYIILSPVI